MTMTLTVVFLFILKCLILHCFGVSSCTVDESKSVRINVLSSFLPALSPSKSEGQKSIMTFKHPERLFSIGKAHKLMVLLQRGQHHDVYCMFV